MSRKNSQNAINILSRLSRAKGVSSDTDLARLLGVKQNTISTWRSRDSLDYKKIIASCDNTIELVYVLTGEECTKAASVPESREHTDSISVPVYPEVSAAAGHGAVNHTEVPASVLMIPVEFLSHGRNGNYKVIFVRGDSMEPTIRPRDPIIIDFGVQSMIETGIYVIRIDGELFIKRLDKLPDGSVRVSSDNRFYEPFVITLDSGIRMDIVGKVVLGLKFM